MEKFKLVESWTWAGAGTQHDLQNGISRATWHYNDPILEGGGRLPRQEVFRRLSFLARLAANDYGVLLGLAFPFSFPVAEKGNRFIDGSTQWIDFTKSIYDALDPPEKNRDAGIYYGQGSPAKAKDFYGTPAMYGQGTPADHFAHLTDNCAGN